MSVDVYGTNPRDMWFHFEPPTDMYLFPAQVISAGIQTPERKPFRVDAAQMRACCPNGFYMMNYSLSGTVYFTCPSEGGRIECAVPPGHLFLGSHHDDGYLYTFPGGEKLETLWICLNGEFPRRVFATLCAKRPVFALPPDSPPIAIVQSLLTTARHNSLSPYALAAAGCEFLIRLKEAEELTLLDDRERIQRKAGEYVRKHLDSVNVDSLASFWGYSGKYFHRYFKRVTGSTPGEFVVAQRLLVVTTLLTNTTAKLSTIARETGFVDASHLCRVFKRHYGQTPDAWRAQQGEGRGSGFRLWPWLSASPALRSPTGTPQGTPGRCGPTRTAGAGHAARC